MRARPPRCSIVFLGGALALGAAIAGCTPLSIEGTPPGSAGLSQACGVETVVAGLNIPLAVAYANQTIFVMDANASGDYRILRVGLDGGVPTVLVQGHAGYMGVLAIGGFSDNYEPFKADSRHLYWEGEDGSLRSVPVNGGPIDVLYTPSQPGFDVVQAIALDDANVYWCDGVGAIKRVPLDGGAVTTLVPASKDGHFARALVLDAANAYWIDSDSSVMKVSLSGGVPTQLISASSLNGPFDMALHGNNLYVANWGNGYTASATGRISGRGSIVKVSTDLGGAELVASNLPDPQSIAADDTGVYLAGGVSRLALGPAPAADEAEWTPVQRLGDGGGLDTIDPKSVAYDMTPCLNAICWPDATTGSVKRYVECDSPPRE